MTLYFDRRSVWFFSLNFYVPFSHMKRLYLKETQWSLIWNFSLSIYWELIANFEFKFNFDFNFGLAFNKNIPCESFLLTLPCGFLHLMLSRGLDTCHFLREWWWLKDLTCGLILFVDCPPLTHHQLEINLIMINQTIVNAS